MLGKFGPGPVSPNEKDVTKAGRYAGRYKKPCCFHVLHDQISDIEESAMAEVGLNVLILVKTTLTNRYYDQVPYEVSDAMIPAFKDRA